MNPEDYKNKVPYYHKHHAEAIARRERILRHIDNSPMTRVEREEALVSTKNNGLTNKIKRITQKKRESIIYLLKIWK